MIGKTLEVADRMVACLEVLYAQFPSDELREALRTSCSWRDSLRERLARAPAAGPTSASR